jgi:hypothetical protein
MAYSSSAMGRVFEKGAAERIKGKFEEILERLGDYEALHSEFCRWLIKNVKTSKGKKPSFGEAAKVLDYMLKVLVSYCHFPSVEEAGKIAFKLNGIIDNFTFSFLKKEYGGFKGVFSLVQIDKKIYLQLQQLLRREAAQEGMTPIEYDEILWRRLVKKDNVGEKK